MVAAVVASVLLPAVPAPTTAQATATATADSSSISRLWLGVDRSSFAGRCVNGHAMDRTGRGVPFRFTLSVDVGRAPVSLRRRLCAASRAHRWHRVDFTLEGGSQRSTPQSDRIVYRSLRLISAAVHYDDGVHSSDPVDVSVRCASRRDDAVLSPVGDWGLMRRSTRLDLFRHAVVPESRSYHLSTSLWQTRRSP
ncbi:hypothetical protein ABZU32_10895 [Sphaerisporangium sp. NPDC005288]|uniref:hypothetical protein n=1 Tax=Sphaerisporangium sp. NPDC005288 TaxID=3155114 RepID=UPI00339EC5EA